MTTKNHKDLKGVWEKFYKDPSQYSGYDFPGVTVVIPTRNSSTSISRTLDSLLNQDYPGLEVLVIDAGSTDRTLEIVNSYQSPIIRAYSVYDDALYEMLNKGVDLASGEYVNFLYPGGYYLQMDTLKAMMALALDHDRPHMVFGGSLIGTVDQPVKVLFRPLEASYLKLGHQPTSIESCWFRTDLFKRLGLFRSRFHLRGGYDMMCRIVLDTQIRAVSTNRVVTDYDLRPYTRKMIMQHFRDTLAVIYHHFGALAAARWLFYQRDIARWIESWIRQMKLAVTGK